MNQDPWGWLQETEGVAPLNNQVIPMAASQEQAGPNIVEQPGFFEQQFQNRAIGAAETGLTKAIDKFNAPLSQTQQAVNSFGAGASLPQAGASTAAPSMYSLSTAAPLAAPTAVEGALTSGIGSGLGLGATSAGGAGTGLTAGLAAPAASTLGAQGAAMAGGEAALAAMGPIGWAIGAGLIGKKLGLF